jgi:hypothetical protein
MLEYKPLFFSGMQKAPNISSDDHLIGVRVQIDPISGELTFNEEKIPKEILARMTRQHLVPILSVSEAEKMERNYAIVDNFAAKFDPE